MIVRQLTFILILFAAVFVSAAEETNYYCVVCGKGPLTGHIWLHQRGAVCDDCYKLPDRCSICGLPIRDGDGAIRTDDGRLICKFDKADAVLDVAEAREVFNDARRDMVELYGSGFALDYSDVTVRLFDVDYWSEKGREDGLHKFGFSHTRKLANGDCTHEVVLLSGRLHNEMAATAAHEYTHLWINENRPPGHVIDSDTIEAICELSGYKLMEDRKQPEQQKKILANPYTHGEILRLVEIEKENGIGYILNWVRNGTSSSLESELSAPATPVWTRTVAFTNAPPPPLPETLKLDGLLLNGTNRRAIIGGVSFAAGDDKQVKLRGRTVEVRCREIHGNEVVLDVDGQPQPVMLEIGDRNFAP
jgi:hypothetical protein